MQNPVEIADTIIDRLNTLIQDPGVRKDIERLIETRVQGVSESTLNHPFIQVTDEGVGVLGILNAIVGANVPHGKHQGWGYIMAEFDDKDMSLIRFIRTDLSNSNPV
jgi:hypothetical protein